MKKDHPIFVQYLFKSMWKSYNYCSFLDKNGHAVFYSVLNVCDFCTIENQLKFRIQKTFNFCTIKFLGYKNCAIIVQLENRLKFRIQKTFNFRNKSKFRIQNVLQSYNGA